MRYPHTISVVYETEGYQGDGGTWIPGSEETLFTTKAHVQPITGRQRFQAQQLETPINHKVFYPAKAGVKPNMRMIWHDRNDQEIALKSDPIDQGGLGKVYMVEGVI